jgi:uncharacterized Zn finger protein
MNPNVKLSDTSEVKCDKCYCSAFTEAVLMRKVSPILTGQAKPGYLPVPTFACAACGHVNEEFVPEELRTGIIKQTVDVPSTSKIIV